MKNNARTISVIIPAFNEAANIQKAIESIHWSLAPYSLRYELIVVNDGSTDETGKISHDISNTDKRIKVIDHPVNQGFGAAFLSGLALAQGEYTTLFPSDNEMDKVSFRNLIGKRRLADLVCAYMLNPQDRSWYRRIISKTFVIFMNILFGLGLNYFNGPFISKTKLLKKVRLVSSGPSLLAEIRIRLIARGATFKETPFTFRARKYGKATLFRWKTVHQTFLTIFVLLRDKLLGQL